MVKRSLFGILALVLFGFAWIPMMQGAGSDEPEVIRLSTGGTKKVAEGRAQLWLGEIDVRYGSEGLVDAAAYELSCDGETFRGWVTEEEATPLMRGCQLRLIEVLDTTPRSARFEVSWTDPSTPGLQAASHLEPVTPVRVEETPVSR